MISTSDQFVMTVRACASVRADSLIEITRFHDDERTHVVCVSHCRDSSTKYRSPLRTMVELVQQQFTLLWENSLSRDGHLTYSRRRKSEKHEQRWQK